MGSLRGGSGPGALLRPFLVSQAARNRSKLHPVSFPRTLGTFLARRKVRGSSRNAFGGSSRWGLARLGAWARFRPRSTRSHRWISTKVGSLSFPLPVTTLVSSGELPSRSRAALRTCSRWDKSSLFFTNFGASGVTQNTVLEQPGEFSTSL